MLTAAAPPTGTVTFLFTDMEGSTRLWDESPDAMNRVIARHDELLEAVVAAHDGYVFSRAGDGWGIAFGSSTAAVQTALEIQDRIAREEWPPPISNVRLRMGMHAGTANLRAGDYFGTAVNRAARVATAANGGQVFLTEAVQALIADEVHADWRIRDLGEHRLRDLTRAEHLWQIDTADTAAPEAQFAPRTLLGNLPKPGAAVLGRSAQIDQISAELTQSQVVTLVGVGGVGKTTLAVETARRKADELEVGAWFVDLTAVDDPDSVASWISAGLGFARRHHMSDIDGLVDALATDERLVVIDNAEHVIEGVAEVVNAVVTTVAGVRMLVTSREPLSISGEIVHRVPPLDIAGSEMSPAVALFIDRALVAAPDLTGDLFPYEVVGRICEHLDGLPLAIELAAAQADIMTADEILEALEADRLVLRSGSRSISPRHRSLDDLVAWSYERLDPVTQRVFARLSNFVGGCTVEAAVAVCGDAAIDAGEVRSALRTLVRKSLVTVDRGGGRTRFTMLETLHHYAERRRLEDPSNVAAEERFARWYAEFSQRAAQAIVSPAEAEWLRESRRELDNLERSARWAIAMGEFDLLGDIGSGLLLIVQANPPPGLPGWIALALDALPSDHIARLDYVYVAGFLTVFSGDLGGWRDLFDRHTAGVPDSPRKTLMRDSFRVITDFFAGNLDSVIHEAPHVIDRARDLADERMLSSITVDYGLALFYKDRAVEAARVAEELRVWSETSGIPSSLAWTHYLLGELVSGSDPAAAVEHYEESVEYGVSVHGDFIVGISLIALASTAGRSGDTAAALDAIYRAIKLWQGMGNRPQFWTSIRNLVEILHRLGHDTDAYRLHLASVAAADQAPELFGPYGDAYRTMVGEISDGFAQSERSAMQSSRTLKYHDAGKYALEVLERLT